MIPVDPTAAVLVEGADCTAAEDTAPVAEDTAPGGTALADTGFAVAEDSALAGTDLVVVEDIGPLADIAPVEEGIDPAPGDWAVRFADIDQVADTAAAHPAPKRESLHWRQKV